MSKVELTEASGYDVKKVIFGEPEVCPIPKSNPPMSYTRINIGTILPNGKTGDLILKTENLFSFGVSENKNLSGEVDGYSMPLCIYSKDGATDAEMHWLNIFNAIVDKCKNHILDVKDHDNVRKYDLEPSELKKFNPLYYKKEKGKIVEGVGPILYAKLIQSKKTGKMITFFSDENGQEIAHTDLLGKYCYATAAIKFESIYVGSKISLQVKLYEASVKIMDMGPKRLLVSSSAPVAPIVSSSTSVATNVAAPVQQKTEIKFSDSVNLDEDEEEEEEERSPTPPPAPAPVARKVVSKKK